MLTSIVTRCVLLYALVVLQGCSVGMAMSGKPEPNIGVLEVGTKRDIVLLNLGQPTKTFAKEGIRTDVFHLERGNQPSTGRAMGHAAMDVLTLGLWEVVGTPIEGFSGDTFTVSIEYDADERVTNINTTPGHSNF